MVNRFVLIDGNAILHRAYHAFPPLSSPDGMTVNAVYGFFSMFLNIVHDIRPTHIALCFDRSKPTIRQSMYANYHAHRPQLANDFALQIPIVHDLLEKMKVTMFAVDGYEGDDLVGTLAHKIVSHMENTDVIIVTGDRDLLQLVNPHVQVLMPVTGVTKTLLFDETKVEEKYGVKPSQFVDYKALIGDASDGYPGVTGIGPKTAANLLQKYGSFEALYERIGELPEKVGLKLATDAEQAALAKKLATIITDAPIQFDSDECATANFDIHALQAEFEKLNFKSLVAKLDVRYPKEERKKQKEKNKNNDNGQLELL